MKKVILAVFFAAVTCVVSAQDSKSPQPAPTVTVTSAVDTKNMPDFKFEVEEYNFGTIKQGESVTYEYVFTNVGKEPLIITNAVGSCGCTVPVWPKEPLKKGEKGTIKVTFNSAGKSGMIDKTVSITSNAKTPNKVLHIKGNIDVPAPKAATPPAEEKVK